MNTADLTRLDTETNFFVVKVRNYKDDPYGEMVSLHGVFTDVGEAGRVADALNHAWPDFMHAEVISLLPANVEAVAAAQHIAHIDPVEVAAVIASVRPDASAPDEKN